MFRIKFSQRIALLLHLFQDSVKSGNSIFANEIKRIIQDDITSWLVRGSVNIVGCKLDLKKSDSTRYVFTVECRYPDNDDRIRDTQCLVVVKPTFAGFLLSVSGKGKRLYENSIGDSFQKFLESERETTTPDGPIAVITPY